MADAGELVVRVSADTKDLESALKSAQKTIDKVGSSFQKVGSQLTRGLTVPIAAAGTAIMGVWQNIDSAEDNIIAKTGAVGDAAKELKGTFKNVFGSMPTDAQTASDAVAELNTQFGLMGKQLEDASKYLIMFSSITGANVTEAAQQAEKAMRMFGISAEHLPEVLDAVAAAGQRTGISTNELMQAVIDLAPQLKKMGFNLASSIQFISETEKAGIDASKAVTYLGRALATGAKKGKSTSAMLEEMAKKFAAAKTETQQTALAMEYFGAKGVYTLIAAIQQGQISLSDLAKAAKQTQDPLAGLAETTGTVAQTYEETLDPIDKFKAKMNDLALKIAPLGVTLQETIEPALTNIIDHIGKLLDWLNKLDPTTKNMIVQVGVALAVLGPLVSIIGGVIKTIATVIGWIGKIVGALQSLWGVVSGVVSAIAGVIGWPALVAAAVAAGVAVVVKYWDQISAFIKTAYKWIVDTFTSLWNTIKGPLQNLWNDVRGWLQPVFDVFVNVFTAIKNAVASIWNSLIGILKTPLNWIIGAVNTVISGLNKIRFSIPSWVPGLGGKSFGINIATIPQLATGGIVTRPTLAMVGEAGPEAVVPLNGQGIGGYIIIKQMIVREEADIDRISQQLASKVLQAQKYRGVR